MKKRHIKNLALSKKTISSLKFSENIKGGNGSNTSCLCGPSQCECLEAADTL
jgi:hypothetical protein